MDIQQQKKFKILLIGDSCKDEYHYGRSHRLSPEAPVPVLNFKNTIVKPGMAANVRENLLAFDCDVDFITLYVADDTPRFIISFWPAPEQSEFRISPWSCCSASYCIKFDRMPSKTMHDERVHLYMHPKCMEGSELKQSSVSTKDRSHLHHKRTRLCKWHR